MENRSSKRILVTGGAGYIGSHTVAELIRVGYQVVVADNFINSRPEVLEALHKITGVAIPFVKTDISSLKEVEDLFAHYKFDAIIHFAAFKSVNESVQRPDLYYRNNLISLLNLVDVALKNGANKLVFSSSCSVYGDPDQLPVSESTPLKKAESPYAFTKQIGERILQDYTHDGTLQNIFLRYFNPAGAHDSALIGEYPLQQPNNLVPVITQTAIGLRPSMDVFGSDYETSDGTCVRDYIHVVDIAQAHVKAIDRLLSLVSTKSLTEIYNLGSGIGNTVMEVIHAFEQVSGQKLNYQLKERREGDVIKVYADVSHAKKHLGWAAEKSLHDILLSAWNWEKALDIKNKQKTTIS